MVDNIYLNKFYGHWININLWEINSQNFMIVLVHILTINIVYKLSLLQLQVLTCI